MTGLIHNLIADSDQNTAPDNLMKTKFKSFEVCLHLLPISLKGALGTKCVSEKVINSE